MKTQSLLNKCIVICFLFVGIIGTFKLNAQTFTVGDLNYIVNGDGISVTVKGHKNGQNANGELIIPESVTYNGNSYAVTIIGTNAFNGCNGLTGSLIIPTTVTAIGAAAFSGCDGLTTVSVNSGNPVYDSRDNCNAIIKTVDNELIAGFKNTIIPNTITSIGNCAFNGCRELTDITIPNSVTAIGDHAFFSCIGLTSITIPNSVISIGQDAFCYCKSLTNITIPISVTTIGDMNVFSGCSGLTEISVDSGNPAYDSRDNCNAIIKTEDNELISGCMNTIIPNSVTSIGYSAFEGCTGLTSITIPNTIITIDIFAFSHCNGLTAISVHDGNLVYDSRDNCNAIITTADNELIVGCMNTIIPNSVTSIGWSAFDGCTCLTNITIPNSVTNIGGYAFSHCSGSNVTLSIGNSVEHIGFGAFYDFSNVTKIEIMATTPPILDDGAFDEFSCSTLIVPCGCVSAYENSAWHNYFSNIIEDCSDVAELDANSVSIYPNPTFGIVKIEAENIRNVSIYNVLEEQLYNSPVSSDVFEYDFSNYESGVYLVRIETSKGIITKRVMVEG